MTVVGFRERVEAWEQAYRDYMAAWEHGRAVLSPVSAANTANAARRVARAWHELAQTRGLPWWCVAALESAAEGFAELARDWASEAGQGGHGQVRSALGGGAGYRGDSGGDRSGSVVSAGPGTGRFAFRADADTSAGRGIVAGNGGVPATAPRLRGRSGGVVGGPRGEA